MTAIAQYLFQAGLKAAVLGLVIMLAWAGLAPIAQPVQDIALYFLNQTLFVWVPYEALLMFSQAAVTISGTFVIAWILDPMAAIHHRLPRVKNDETRASEEDESPPWDEDEPATNYITKDKLQEIEDSLSDFFPPEHDNDF